MPMAPKCGRCWQASAASPLSDQTEGSLYSKAVHHARCTLQVDECIGIRVSVSVDSHSFLDPMPAADTLLALLLVPCNCSAFGRAKKTLQPNNLWNANPL